MLNTQITESVTAVTVLLQGLISSFSPCVLPLVPLYLAYLTGNGQDIQVERSKISKFLNILLFTVGIATAFFVLGFGFTSLGKILVDIKPVLSLIGGVIIIIFGLIQLFGSHLLMREYRFGPDLLKWQMNPLIAFLLGFFFSFAWTPCVGPTLASVLFLAGSQAELAYMYIGLYSLGFILVFWLTGFLATQILDKLKRHPYFMQAMVKCGAVLMILIGILIITGGFNRLSIFFNNLVGG